MRENGKSWMFLSRGQVRGNISENCNFIGCTRVRVRETAFFCEGTGTGKQARSYLLQKVATLALNNVAATFKKVGIVFGDKSDEMS